MSALGPVESVLVFLVVLVPLVVYVPSWVSLCVPRVLRGSVFHFRAAKMRSRMASIDPTPGILTYFGAPAEPLFAHLE